jgi:excisionase family DNA binding protein
VSEKLLYSFAEVSRLAEISESMIKKMVRKRQLEVVKIGRAVRIPRHALLRLCGVNGQPEFKSESPSDSMTKEIRKAVRA